MHPATPSPAASRRALRLIAALEAAKGCIVFGAGFGMLSLLHRDVRQLAVGLVTRLHLDPERHFAGVFLNAATHLTDARLWGLAGLALAYSALREVEAYGLWMQRRWASWLGAAGGAIYIPVEVYELWEHPSAIKTLTLTFNVAVVAYLVWTLRRAPRVDLASA
ncbi:MAG: DUF2127 domain-containing protein [Pseudomonadota bacterium]|nr:DUF2127 domain-containing protein [Pseudomonadota bacterium]